MRLVMTVHWQSSSLSSPSSSFYFSFLHSGKYIYPRPSFPSSSFFLCRRCCSTQHWTSASFSSYRTFLPLRGNFPSLTRHTVSECVERPTHLSISQCAILAAVVRRDRWGKHLARTKEQEATEANWGTVDEGHRSALACHPAMDTFLNL